MVPNCPLDELLKDIGSVKGFYAGFIVFSVRRQWPVKEYDQLQVAEQTLEQELITQHR